MTCKMIPKEDMSFIYVTPTVVFWMKTFVLLHFLYLVGDVETLEWTFGWTPVARYLR